MTTLSDNNTSPRRCGPSAPLTALPDREAEARQRQDVGGTVINARALNDVRAWSDRTFGPGPRVAGVLDHIRKELAEVAENPNDLSEWADIIILGFDGATRSGASGQAVIDAIFAKWLSNMARDWPDWRTQPLDRAIEHIRDQEGVLVDSGLRRAHGRHGEGIAWVLSDQAGRQLRRSA